MPIGPSLATLLQPRLQTTKHLVPVDVNDSIGRAFSLCPNQRAFAGFANDSSRRRYLLHLHSVAIFLYVPARDTNYVLLLFSYIKFFLHNRTVVTEFDKKVSNIYNGA